MRLLIESICIIVACSAAAYYSYQHPISFDLSSERQHTLSAETLDILERISAPVTLHAYASTHTNSGMRRVRDVISRYQSRSKHLSLSFIGREESQKWVQKFGDLKNGQIILVSEGKSELALSENERDIAAALLRVSRKTDKFIVMLTGHGERSAFSTEALGYSRFYAQAKLHGFNIQEINLATLHQIPSNAHAVIIASPANNYIEAETATIRDYVSNGGNVIWLIDPSQGFHGLAPLAEDLSLELLPGVVVDTKTQLLGIADPSFALLAEYPPHTITESLQGQTSLFPHASGLIAASDEWTTTAILHTDENTWTETSEISGEIAYSPEDDESRGPITLGYAFDREVNGSAQSQRVVVIGDADFLSNAYIDTGANLPLGINMLNWIDDSDALMGIHVPRPADRQIDLGMSAQVILFCIFIIFIPGGFASVGLFRWLRARQ